MISLLWLGILINIFRIFIPNIASWAVKTFFQSNTSEIQTTQKELKACRNDLSNISIVDEFAKHARLSRKIAALQSQLEKECKLNVEQCNKMKSKLTMFFTCSMVTICAVIFFKSSQPVVRIPHQWMMPLSYFGHTSWSIGFTSWVAMSYLSAKHLHSAITST